jgi:hypothetical protein
MTTHKILKCTSSRFIGREFTLKDNKVTIENGVYNIAYVTNLNNGIVVINAVNLIIHAEKL